ncbi:MAG: FAD-binding oxidoreductase [bacterium]|nr:FAD-binding oxidoreductase [bacterium]
MENKNREFVLVSKKDEAENIASLFFKPADGAGFNFIAGQYVSVKVPSIVGRSKCYTISSSPNEKLICLTVKRQGVFSSALIDTAINDKLIFGGPYGKFYPEENCEDIVFIAGGIGVTPFFSVIKEKINSKAKPKLTLLYSNKTISGIAFFDELNDLAKNKGIDKLVYFLTQEKGKHPLVQEYSRMNKESLKKHLVSFGKRNYYLCGSIQFVNAIWKDLKESGVPEENIFTESFY